MLGTSHVHRACERCMNKTIGLEGPFNCTNLKDSVKVSLSLTMEAFNPDSPPVSPDVAYETVVSTAAKEVRYEAFISLYPRRLHRLFCTGTRIRQADEPGRGDVAQSGRARRVVPPVSRLLHRHHRMPEYRHAVRKGSERVNRRRGILQNRQRNELCKSCFLFTNCHSHTFAHA